LERTLYPPLRTINFLSISPEPSVTFSGNALEFPQTIYLSINPARQTIILLANRSSSAFAAEPGSRGATVAYLMEWSAAFTLQAAEV